MATTYYDILNVSNKATGAEIKRAYRSLQMKHHPDKNNGDASSINMTQQLNEAYETLSDELRRQEYDIQLQVQFNPTNFHDNGFRSFGGTRSFGINPMMDFDDIVKTFFSGDDLRHAPNIHVFGGFPIQSNQPRTPDPITKQVSVRIEQILDGVSIPIEIERRVFTQDGCMSSETETIYIDIPQGADNGEIILVPKKGNSNGIMVGDVKVVLTVLNVSPFVRHGLDLVIEKKISLKESLCGFSFELMHLNGKKYTLCNGRGNVIPPEYKKVYHDLGITRNGRTGCMIIVFHVEFPSSLTIEQVDVIEKTIQ